MKDFRTPKAGESFSAKNLADWLSETRRLGKWDVTNGTLTADAGGMHLSLNPSDGIWAKITAVGTGGKYSWQEIALEQDGTGWYDPEFPQLGAYDGDAAIEANLLETLEVNTIIYLMPGIYRGIPENQNTELAYTPTYRIFFAGGTGGGGGGNVSSVQCVGNVLYVTYGT